MKKSEFLKCYILISPTLPYSHELFFKKSIKKVINRWIFVLVDKLIDDLIKSLLYHRDIRYIRSDTWSAYNIAAHG